MLRQRDDGLRQGRREQQRAALGGRGLEDEFQIFAEADSSISSASSSTTALSDGDLQRAAFEMIAQPSRRADHDVGAARQLAALAARIHAADAGDHARAGVVIEPGQLALHLQRQFAGRRDDQRQRRAGRAEGLGAVQQVSAIARP